MVDEKVLEKVVNDNEFMEKLARQTDFESVKNMLHEAGLDFTDEEINLIIEGVHEVSKELTPDELEEISGGSKTTRVIGTTIGAGIGTAVGLPASVLTFLLGSTLGRKISYAINRKCSELERIEKATVGMVVGGIISAGATVVGMGVLGGFGGNQFAKAFEK